MSDRLIPVTSVPKVSDAQLLNAIAWSDWAGIDNSGCLVDLVKLLLAHQEVHLAPPPAVSWLPHRPLNRLFDNQRLDQSGRYWWKPQNADTFFSWLTPHDLTSTHTGSVTGRLIRRGLKRLSFGDNLVTLDDEPLYQRTVVALPEPDEEVRSLDELMTVMIPGRLPRLQTDGVSGELAETWARFMQIAQLNLNILIKQALYGLIRQQVVATNPQVPWPAQQLDPAKCAAVIQTSLERGFYFLGFNFWPDDEQPTTLIVLAADTPEDWGYGP